MEQASSTKMDHGWTAPKASGPNSKTALAPISRAVLVSRGGETLPTAAGSGWVAKAELTGHPSMGWPKIHRQEIGWNRPQNYHWEKVRNRRAKACPESGNPPGTVRSQAPAA